MTMKQVELALLKQSKAALVIHLKEITGLLLVLALPLNTSFVLGYLGAFIPKLLTEFKERNSEIFKKYNF